MPEIFHLEAYVSKQDFPDFGPRPMGPAHGAGAGAGALVLLRQPLKRICTRKK